MKEDLNKTVPEVTKEFLEKSENPYTIEKGINIYKAKSDDYKELKLSMLINNTIKDMAIFADNVKIPLSDYKGVKVKTMEYMQECAALSVYPTFEGLSHALGYTERDLRKAEQTAENLESIKWLDFCKEKFSAILTENALKSNANSAYSMFYQKAAYGLKESSEIIITPNASALGDKKNIDDIISELPE